MALPTHQTASAPGGSGAAEGQETADTRHPPPLASAYIPKMPARSWDDLYKAIRKGDLPVAVYLYGTEDPLKDEAVAELLDRALDPSLRDFNLDIRSAASLDPDDVTSLLTTLPMMAERRVVIVRDVEAWTKRAKARQAVLRELASPAPENLLILVQGPGEATPDAELAKLAWTVNCERLPPERAARWLVKHAEGVGLSLAPAAVEHLVKVLDADLGALRGEVGKLAGLAGGEPLSVAQVSQMLGVRHGETQQDWRDLVMAGNAGRAATLLPILLAQPGISGVKLVTLLGQALVGTAMARALLDEDKRGRALESAVFDALRRARLWGIDYRATAAQWSSWAVRWSAPALRDGLAAALDADQALKSTTLSNEGGILTDLVMRLAEPLVEAA